MLGTMLSMVGYLIYWIMTYDTHSPNDLDNHQSESVVTQNEGMEV